MSTYHTQNNPDEAHNSHTHSESINKKVKLSIPRTGILDVKCLICDKRDNLFKIAKATRINTFVDQRIFIPDGARCCKRHIREQKILLDDRSN